MKLGTLPRRNTERYPYCLAFGVSSMQMVKHGMKGVDSGKFDGLYLPALRWQV